MVVEGTYLINLIGNGCRVSMAIGHIDLQTSRRPVIHIITNNQHNYITPTQAAHARDQNKHLSSVHCRAYSRTAPELRTSQSKPKTKHAVTIMIHDPKT